MNYKVFSEDQLEQLKKLSIKMQDIILDAYDAANIVLNERDEFFVLCKIELETLKELSRRKRKE